MIKPTSLVAALLAAGCAAGPSPTAEKPTHPHRETGLASTARTGPAPAQKSTPKSISTAGSSLSDDYLTTVALSRQQTLAHYRHAMEQARRHAEAKRYDRAQAAVAYALAVLNRRRTTLNQSEFQAMHLRATERRRSLERRR
ncbi:MAG: hypothetical protein R3236_00775 [Phycisphaeraceae bacterium]|nr:hypothetical protein [Phycisphaeraceae bacterium]